MKFILVVYWMMSETERSAFSSRPVSMNSQMTPHMAQAAPSAGQMLAQMSRQNGVTHSVTPPHTVPPASTVAPLQGGPSAGGWPASGAAARPQFNNQVIPTMQSTYHLLPINSGLSSTSSLHLIFYTIILTKSTNSRVVNILQKFSSNSVLKKYYFCL